MTRSLWPSRLATGRAPLLRAVLVLTAYTLLALLLTHPLLFNLTTTVPHDPGDPLLNTWVLAWDAHALLTDPAHLFDANIFHPLPQTLAYSEHLFSLALVALPVQLASGEPLLAYNLSLLASFPLAGLGGYLLALRWTHHRRAAFIAGLVFAFNPYRFAAIAHLQLLAYHWLPFAVLCLDLLLGATRDEGSRLPSQNRMAALSVALTLFLLLQLLASWYLVVYAIFILGIYGMVRLATGTLTRRNLVPLLFVGIFVAGLTLPFALPYLSLVDEMREMRSLTQALFLSAVPTDFLAAAPFNRLFGPMTEAARAREGFTGEHRLFLGVLPWLLALAAGGSWLFQKQARREASRGTVVALVLVLAANIVMTFPTPTLLVAQAIPFSTILRVPARWVVSALLALAGLSAFGYVALARGARRQLANLLFLGCSLWLVVEALSIPLPLVEVDNRATLHPVYHWLADQPGPFALVELPLYSLPALEYPEGARLYASTLGWWRLVNGYSGYTPRRQPLLAQALASFPDERAVGALEALAQEGNSAEGNPMPLLVLVHPGEGNVDPFLWENAGRWQAERHPALRAIGEFEGLYLYQVLPPDSPVWSGAPLATLGSNQEIRLLAVERGWVQTDGLFPKKERQQLALYWQAAASPAADYTLFIHLRAADGTVVGQADGPVMRGLYPMTMWQAGERLEDTHSLPLDAHPNADHLAIGLYDASTLQRLPAFGADGQRLPEDGVIIPIR